MSEQRCRMARQKPETHKPRETKVTKYCAIAMYLREVHCMSLSRRDAEGFLAQRVCSTFRSKKNTH